MYIGTCYVLADGKKPARGIATVYLLTPPLSTMGVMRTTRVLSNVAGDYGVL